jgi:gluconate kinase
MKADMLASQLDALEEPSRAMWSMPRLGLT